MGQLIIVSSVSGAGKTTLVDKALVPYNMYRLKTCTTRPIRPEEIGNEYYFYSTEEFLDYVEVGEFVEYAEVYGKHYGLLKSEIERHANLNCIAVMDVQGAANIRELYPNAVTIFIEPPSHTELEYRIFRRNTGEEDAFRRLAEIESELTHMKDFTHVVSFGSLPEMTKSFNNLIKSIID